MLSDDVYFRYTYLAETVAMLLLRCVDGERIRQRGEVEMMSIFRALSMSSGSESPLNDTSVTSMLVPLNRQLPLAQSAAGTDQRIINCVTCKKQIEPGGKD
jgi:hypothetical protein